MAVNACLDDVTAVVAIKLGDRGVYLCTGHAAARLAGLIGSADPDHWNDRERYALCCRCGFVGGAVAGGTGSRWPTPRAVSGRGPNSSNGSPRAGSSTTRSPVSRAGPTVRTVSAASSKTRNRRDRSDTDRSIPSRRAPFPTAVPSWPHGVPPVPPREVSGELRGPRRISPFCQAQTSTVKLRRVCQTHGWINDFLKKWYGRTDACLIQATTGLTNSLNQTIVPMEQPFEP